MRCIVAVVLLAGLTLLSALTACVPDRAVTGPPSEPESSEVEPSKSDAPAPLKGPGGKLTAEGISRSWDDIKPIPFDAGVILFAITRLGDTDGRWEFRVVFE